MQGKYTGRIILASAVIIAVWLLLLNSNVSKRIKRFVTALVTISPIPPIP